MPDRVARCTVDSQMTGLGSLVTCRVHKDQCCATAGTVAPTTWYGRPSPQAFHLTEAHMHHRCSTLPPSWKLVGNGLKMGLASLRGSSNHHVQGSQLRLDGGRWIRPVQNLLPWHWVPLWGTFMHAHPASRLSCRAGNKSQLCLMSSIAELCLSPHPALAH